MMTSCFPWHRAILLASAGTSLQRSIVRLISSATILSDKIRSESWPIVISGGGPSGLATALLLSRYNVPCLVLERNVRLTDHPQAHYINHRTMEVFRGISGLAEEVSHAMPPLSQWRRFVYCTALTGGEVLGVVDHFKGQTSGHVPQYSPEPVAHLSQHRLLPLLARRVIEAPGVEFRMGSHVDGIINTDGNENGLTIAVSQSDSGQKYRVRCQYLVAADGAHSSLRKSAGIGLLGPGTMQHLINIHFISPDLGAQLSVMNREGMLYFVFNSSVIAVIVAHDLRKGEFVAQVPYFPPLQDPAEFTPEMCARLVRRAAGDDSLRLEVRTVRPWAMAAAVAEGYTAPAFDNRLILVGDAAHVVPPSGAFGMNTGLQDAHNLAWKLALAVQFSSQHQLAERLIRSYEAERRPVAEANMRLSVANFHEALEVPRIMGLDYQTATAVSGVLAGHWLGWVPASLRRTVLDGAISAGRAAGEAMARLRREKLEVLFESGSTLRLQYPKEDLGFVYGNGTNGMNLVTHESNDSQSLADYVAPKPRAAPYQPTTLPGARLPHFPLIVLRPGKLLPELLQNGEISSIDIPVAAGLAFVLLINEQGSAIEWVHAVRGGVKGIEVLPVVVVADRGSPAMEMEALKNVAVVQDVNGEWPRFLPDGADRGTDGVAVLVRPDGHVAWRGGKNAVGVAQKRDVLEVALREILALEAATR